jgi:dTDP-4-amino-4,6-dideoxygalactose transaminase
VYRFRLFFLNDFITLFVANMNQYNYQMLSNCKNIELTKNPEYANNNNWLNVIKIKNAKNLDKYIKYFEKNKIQVRPVWQMNHTQKQFKNYQTYNIVNAYKLVKDSLCLPSSYSLKTSEISKITNILKKLI